MDDKVLTIDQIHNQLQHDLGDAWEKYDGSEYEDAESFTRWGEEYEAAYAKAKLLLTRLMDKREIEGQIKMINHLEPMTHNGRGTILWEIDAISTEMGVVKNILEQQLKSLNSNEESAE